MSLPPYKERRYRAGSKSKARANSAISRPGLVLLSTHSNSFSVVTLFTWFQLDTHCLIREGGKSAHRTIRLIISFDVPLLTLMRVMLAWLHNKKSSLKPVRNSSTAAFYVRKRACLPHKIVPRARNYDLNWTRTTLTAIHKTWDLSISCRQNSGCEKIYLPRPQNVAECESLTLARDMK